MAGKVSTKDYVAGVRASDRAMLARAITLIESEQPSHAALAQEVLTELLPDTGGAHRVGISGVPGAGKSTFIDALGTMLTEKGHRVAVLAVDPSSSVSGGSILADKTRMAALSRDERAFIRPSPTSGTLGGVARKTRETTLLCEAAGFDAVLVETVGVGQSETLVSEMVDFFLVLLIAGAGDEIQGIKRGILEMADMVAINKADGDNVAKATQAKMSYGSALRLMRGEGAPSVVTCSAHEKTGLAELWDEVAAHHVAAQKSGDLARRRAAQQVGWMWQMIKDGLIQTLKNDPTVKSQAAKVEAAVREGTKTATSAAQEILAAFRS